MRAVADLRKHEKKALGEIHEIAPRSYGSDQPPLFPAPKTPEEIAVGVEWKPGYWKPENEEAQPRTPEEAQRRYIEPSQARGSREVVEEDEELSLPLIERPLSR
jgi:hypothetical protein